MFRYPTSPETLRGGLPQGGDAVITVRTHASDIPTTTLRERTFPRQGKDGRRVHPPIPLDPPTTALFVLVPRLSTQPVNIASFDGNPQVVGPVIAELSTDVIRALSKQGAALVVVYDGPVEAHPGFGDGDAHK